MIECQYRKKPQGEFATCELLPIVHTDCPDGYAHESGCKYCLTCDEAKDEYLGFMATWWRKAGYFRGQQPPPPPAQELAKVCPPPEKRFAVRPIRWAIAIMTAPRTGARNYLPSTLESIKSAGFPKPFIFAEPGSPIPKEYEEQTLRWPAKGGPVGIYQNSLGAMRYLWTSVGVREWDALLLLEDDVQLARGMREYLDQCLWPCDPMKIGLIQVFVSGTNSQGPIGWSVWPDWHRYCTAQAFLLSNRLVGEFINDPVHLNRRRWRQRLGPKDPNEQPYMDGVLPPWCAQKGKEIWIVRGEGGMSLVKHVGERSTLGLRHKLDGNRAQAGFIGERKKSPCAARKAVAKHPDPCVHRGDVIQRTSPTCDRLWLYQCKLLGEQVIPQNRCEQCEKYEKI